jgi:hypothetical protein
LAGWRGEALVLAAAIELLGLIVAYLAALPPTRFSTGVERYPPTLIFRNFYGVETNAGGAYRWGKPSAALTFPIDAPATYRLSLRLSDAPAAIPRVVTVYVDGVEAGTITPDATAREYPLVVALTSDTWARNDSRTVTVELIAPAFVPEGDSRPLGALLSGIAVEPTTARAGGFLALFGAALLLMLILYGAARMVLSPRGGALALGVTLCALAGVAALDRSAALWLAWQPLRSPPLFGAALLGVLALAALARYALRADLPPDRLPGTPATDSTFGAEPTFWSRASWPIVPLLLVAGVVRAYQFDALNLWFDEGATIRFAKLPWPEVLGLRGQYEPHPPFYYAAVKLLEIALPVVSAGRLLSIVVGTATVAVLYALAARLLGRVGAVGAALVLSLSPLHLWYSREARMYAPATLLIALAALALVGFTQPDRQRDRWGWAALYGFSCLLAMYTVYSALYSLAAQGVILAFLTWLLRRQTAPLWGALGLAAVAYLPWVPQIFSGVAGLDNRSGALGPTPARLREVVLAAVGLGGIGQRGESYYPGLWESAAVWRVPALIFLALVVTLGCVALFRRSRLAALSAGSLLVGTIVVALVTSAYSPGFSPRTLLPIVLGWSLLIGAALTFRSPRPLVILARVGLVVVLLCSLGTVRAMSVGAEKQQYRQAAQAGAVAATFGQPVIAIGYMAAFFDAYAPDLRYAERSALDRLGETSAPPAFWLAYGEDPWEDMPAVRERLVGRGFERLTHNKFGDTIYLDLFVRRDAALGTPRVGFAERADEARSWQLPPEGLRVDGAGVQSGLTLTGEANLPRRASLTVPVTARQLYILQADVRATLTQGRALASLSCLDASGTTIAIASAELPDGQDRWQTARAALWCPPETIQLRVDFDNRGVGEATFRAIGLNVIAPGGR